MQMPDSSFFQLAAWFSAPARLEKLLRIARTDRGASRERPLHLGVLPR